MLVEHAFITTDTPDAALLGASTLLTRMGFVCEPCSEPNCVAFLRGRNKPQQAKKLSELPQHVRVAFDRGRVSVAASITEYRKAERLHRELLLTLAAALEANIGRAMAAETALADWNLVHEHIEAQARARRRTKRIVVGVLLAIIVGVIGLIIWEGRH